MPLALTRAEDFHKQNRAETHDFAPQNRGFGYQPALDGVRAIAVAMVLVFHAGYRWMSGGYVGVSVFFTLSGFLITSLALVEHDRSGRLDAGAFYARRVRRLLPASLVCLLGVMVAAWAGQFHGVTNLRRDLWGALAQVYNWVALAGRGSYAQQMARAAGQRAPLDHYWSLSIEEQFYWVWPLVLIVVLRWSAPRRVAAVAGLTAACTVAAVVIAVAAGPDAAYYATPARLPEILAGALLAVGVHAAPRWHVRVPSVLAGVVAAAALTAIVTVAVVWPADGGPATAGWMPAFAVASVVLIGALQVPSPVRGLLSVAPLVALGRISYGVYLFHWPIYTLVDERRVPVGRTALFVLRVALTLAAAIVSYHFLERPLRRGSRPGRAVLACAAGACLAVAALVPLVPDRPGTYAYLAESTRAAAAIPPAAPLIPLAPLAQRPLRVLVLGDSTAFAAGEGLIQWAAEHPDVAQVSSLAVVGCGLDPSGVLADDAYAAECARARQTTPRQVARLRPDVVIAMVTFRDMEDRTWSDVDGVLTPTDPRYRRHLLDGYRFDVQTWLSAGAGHVLWVVPPVPDLPAIGDLAPMLDPARIEAYDRVVRTLPLSFPGRVGIVDMAAWMLAQHDAPDRPDGLHFSLDGAVAVADRLLMPAAVAAASGA